MSVEELPVIQQISQRLDSLLERARILKPHTIEPPLEASSFGKDIANLTDRNQFSAVETVARKSFYTILVRGFSSARLDRKLTVESTLVLLSTNRNS